MFAYNNKVAIHPIAYAMGFLALHSISKTISQNITMKASENETVFTFSNGTTQTVDVVGELSRSSYSVPSGAVLTGVKIGRHVTTIGDAAFFFCPSLSLATIPNSVTAIGNSAFRNCSSLASINIPSSVTTIKYGAFGGCTSLTSVDIPNTVTTIGDGAFYNCTSLISVTIQNGAEIIGDNAFAYGTSLTSVNIPDSAAVIKINAFYDVPHITYHGNAIGAPWGAKAIN